MKVRGITIEIGGDTTKLEASRKSVNQEIKGTESKLKDINKRLKRHPNRQIRRLRMARSHRTSMMPCSGKSLRLNRI